MKLTHRLIAVGAASAAFLAVGAAGAGAKVPGGNNGQKAAFFTGGSGTAGWVSGDDPLAPGDTDGKVMALSSPDGSSYGGFVANALNGEPITSISALSYDFAVTSSDWNGGGGGSPRLVVDFSDGGSIDLNPVTMLTPGQWVHMDAMSGAVDNNGGSCGYLYQASWSTVLTCHSGATVEDAFLVVDSGWIAPMNVQVDNLVLNNRTYSSPGTAKR